MCASPAPPASPAAPDRHEPRHCRHRLSPVIDRVFPFNAAVEALRYYAAGKSFGKVVIMGS